MARVEVDTGTILLTQAVPIDRIRHLVQAGDELAGAADDVTAVHQVLTESMLPLPGHLAGVWVDAGNGRLHLAAARHADASRSEGLRAALARAGGLGDAGQLVLRTGRVLRAGCPHLQEWRVPPSLTSMAQDLQVCSVILAPVWGRHAPLGVIAVARVGRAAPFTQADADFVVVLARRAGMTMETAQLLEQVRNQAAVVDSVSDAVIAVDRAGTVTTWNAAAERMYGIPAAKALGRHIDALIEDSYDTDDQAAPGGSPPERPRGYARQQALRLGAWRGRVRQTSTAGFTVEVETSLAVRRNVRGEFDGLVAVNRDLTEVLAARAATRAQETFTQDLMDVLDSRAAVVDGDGVVVSANARWLAGVTDRDRCRCGPVPEGTNWLSTLQVAQLNDIRLFAADVGAVLAGHRPAAQLECRCLEAGPERATAIQVTRLHGARNRAVVVQSDVSWRRRMEDELTHRATHDELTGLPNRAALMDRLQASIRRLDGEQMLAVLFCDLDGFKDINDGLGHAVGDQVLVAVARRLRQRCRQADVVARFGGDEFVVVLPVPDVARARATAERLVEALSEPIAVGDAEVAPGASIGVTVVEAAPEGDDPVGTLLRDADTAMYHAKERGRGRHELFTARLRVDISQRLDYAAALRRAVGNQELTLVFQTRRYCGDRRVAGVEALMRWQHPTFGRVPPSTFIPIAERTGRIVEVGGWALRRALAEMAELEDRRLTVAVNVSPRQLSAPRMVEMVDSALASSGLEPWRLVLEITEGALVDDPDAARSVLTDLRRLGVTIALDDFGTGWSSMSYLRTLPVDVLKIDRTFVADLPRDPDACAVVSAVLGLGHGMGLVVVAEGVEDEDQLGVLRDMGCDEYQGYIDGKPGSLVDVLAVEP